MTELEKIARAKMYMDKLANGIDPISDTPAPDGDIINQVRLSRCFFFVSDVLRQVIENGGVRPAVPAKKPLKRPFELSVEERSRFAYSEKPIPISEIANRANALADSEDMQKCSYSDILEWLGELGMIEWINLPDGKRVRRPTQAGREMGISVEERMGDRGSYQAVVYNLKAQEFVIDNLEAVSAAKEARTELQGTPWEIAHDDCLRDLYQKSVPVSEIAVTLKRSVPEVRKRIKKLGLDLQWLSDLAKECRSPTPLPDP